MCMTGESVHSINGSQTYSGISLMHGDGIGSVCLLDVKRKHIYPG